MAPDTRSVRISRWPIFDVFPSRAFPLVECCFGTRPRLAPKGVLSARRIDHLGALAKEHLTCAKQHGAGLLIFRLHGDKAPSQRCLHRLPDNTWSDATPPQ